MYIRLVFDATSTYMASTVEIMIKSVIPEIRKLHSNLGLQIYATFIPYSKKAVASRSNKIHKVTFEQC